GDEAAGDGDHRLELRGLADDRALLGELGLEKERDDLVEPDGLLLLVRERRNLLPGDEVRAVREPDVDEGRGAVADRGDDAARLVDPGGDAGDRGVARKVP